MAHFRVLRLRFPELLDAAGLSPRELVERSGGRISRATAYRLVRLKGRLKTFDAGLCEVLCEVLRIRDLDRLFELEGAPKAKKAKRG